MLWLNAIYSFWSVVWLYWLCTFYCSTVFLLYLILAVPPLTVNTVPWFQNECSETCRGCAAYFLLCYFSLGLQVTAQSKRLRAKLWISASSEAGTPWMTTDLGPHCGAWVWVWSFPLVINTASQIKHCTKNKTIFKKNLHKSCHLNSRDKNMRWKEWNSVSLRWMEREMQSVGGDVFLAGWD